MSRGPNNSFHDHARPIACFERLRRRIRDVTCRHHRNSKIGFDRVANDPFLLNQSERAIEIFEERNGSEEEQIYVVDLFQAFFLGVMVAWTPSLLLLAWMFRGAMMRQQRPIP